MSPKRWSQGSISQAALLTRSPVNTKRSLFLSLGEIDTALHAGCAVEAARVNVGELGDGKAVEGGRKVGEVEGLAVDPIVVFALEHRIGEADEGDGGEAGGYLADEAAAGGNGRPGVVFVYFVGDAKDAAAGVAQQKDDAEEEFCDKEGEEEAEDPFVVGGHAICRTEAGES